MCHEGPSKRQAFCCSRQNISCLPPQRAPQISKPANCTNSSLKVSMRQEEVPCPLRAGGVWGGVPSIASCQPSPQATAASIHSERPPWPSSPPPSHLLGAHVPGESPQFQTTLPRPRVSQPGDVGVSCCPPFPGPPPRTPLESTSRAGRNHRRGRPPNGSTELTLDNNGSRRKGRERLRDLGILPAGHPKQKRGTGCLWFGNSGRRGLGEESPSPCLSRILLTSSGQSRVGRQPWERAGRPPGSAPTLRMGEGWREPAFHFCSPGAAAPPPHSHHLAFSPFQGWGRGEDTPHRLGSSLPTGHLCASQEPRAPPPGSHGPSPGGLTRSLSHRPLQPDGRKTRQRCPHGKTRSLPAVAFRMNGEGTQNGRREGFGS